MYTTLIRSFVVLVALFFAHVAFAEVVREITFPVNGANSFRNDFHEPRGEGTRLHMGNDIIAGKMTPLVAVADGYISYVAIPEQSWGYEIELQADDGYTYDYLHVNNDTPGTDDGKGGIANAYVTGVVRGARVSRGQHIGWVGDSGNAETTLPHLHFEMRDSNHVVINPYESLRASAGTNSNLSNVPQVYVDIDPERDSSIELRYIFTKELREGVDSREVKQLQLTLRTFGHFKHPSLTGYFGPVTRDAVLSYQFQKKLPQTGVVDAKTRFALNADLGTYDPNVYIPFYSETEQRAILIQKLINQIAELQKQLRTLQGLGGR